MIKNHDTFWRNRPVFVTGGSGFLGGWLIKGLLEAGAEVITLVRDRRPNTMLVRDNLLNALTVVNGAVEDLQLLNRSMAEYSVQTVFHLAAQPLVGIAKVDPLSTLKANVVGTWNILEAARATKVRQVVVASSDKAYGASSSLPYVESHSLNGQYPYDVSKSCADLISRMYANTYSLPVCITRFANLFGGGDLNFSRTIPGVIRAALFKERFQIRSDGLFVRDVLYVRDAVKAYLQVAASMAERPDLNGEAFNFSLELRLTILELVDAVADLMGCDLKPVILNRVSDEIREQYLSCEKARRVLGWKPEYTLASGLRETIDWYCEFFRAAGAPMASAAEL